MNKKRRGGKVALLILLALAAIVAGVTLGECRAQNLPPRMRRRTTELSRAARAYPPRLRQCVPRLNAPNNKRFRRYAPCGDPVIPPCELQSSDSYPRQQLQRIKSYSNE